MEKELAEFLRASAFRVTEDEVSGAMKETMKAVKERYDNKLYRKGLFFNMLLESMGRDIDWNLCEYLETEFIKAHKIEFEELLSA